MSLVTRYFSTSAAGSGDGTTWANRAALFSAGAWSSIITGFNFTAGIDGLFCLTGPGTYVISSSLNTGAFSSGTPNAKVPLLLHGCDSSGNALSPPNADWAANQPIWDTSLLPLLSSSANTLIVNTTGCQARLVALSGSSTNQALANLGFGDWLYAVNSTSNSSAIALSCLICFNSWLECSGTTYGAIVTQSSAGRWSNNRLKGNPSATGTSGHGFSDATTSGSSVIAERNCIESVFGNGFHLDSSNANTSTVHLIRRNTIVNVGGVGIYGHRTAAATPGISAFELNQITGCGGAGIDVGNSAILLSNRLRDNAGGNTINPSNFPELDSYTTDSDDATEYVNAAAGDYRIKTGSAIWGKGYGVSDQPSSGSGGISRARLVNA